MAREITDDDLVTIKGGGARIGECGEQSGGRGLITNQAFPAGKDIYHHPQYVRFY